MELQKVLYDVLDKMEELRCGTVLCGIITRELAIVLRARDAQKRVGYTIRDGH